MFKYLKQLFHDVVMSQQFVAITENPQSEITRSEEEEIVNQPMENLVNSTSMNSPSVDARLYGSSINRIDCTDLRESPMQMRKERPCLGKSASETFLEAEETDFDSRANRYHEEEEIALEDTEEAEEKCCQRDNTCGCENCSIVSEINECGVCLEPLQTRGVRSCPLCANVVCRECATQLKKCAFCRIALPMQKNRAFERLLGKLSLPCRNARSGCQKLLKSETRLRHEASCHYGSYTCPVLRGSCSWQGSQDEILNHLKDVHDLKPLDSHGIAVEVSNYRTKSVAKLGECTVYLCCYNQLFAVKVTPYRKKLILTFYQLGYVGPLTEEIGSRKFGVWVKVRGVGGKKIKGILPFSTFDREIREIEIDSDRLFSKRGRSSLVADTVNIVIAIREMDDA